MQLFLLFSIPLFFGHLIHRHRENLQDLIPVRKRAVNGMLWAGLALILLLVLSLILSFQIHWLSMYAYVIAMYYAIPVLFTLFAAKKYLGEYRKEGDRGFILYQSQLAGFFAFYNIGYYFINITSLDQINVLFIPVFHLLLITVLARLQWRSLRFEIQWRSLMIILCLVIFFSLPVIQLLYGLLREFWAWVLAVGLTALSVLIDWFFSRLERDIQYRLSLEKRFKPLMRIFFRPGRRA
jgi:hypothetical protein